MKIKPGLHEFLGRFPFQNSPGIEAHAGIMPIGRVQQNFFLFMQLMIGSKFFSLNTCPFLAMGSRLVERKLPPTVGKPIQPLGPKVTWKFACQEAYHVINGIV